MDLHRKMQMHFKVIKPFLDTSKDFSMLEKAVQEADVVSGRNPLATERETGNKEMEFLELHNLPKHLKDPFLQMMEEDCKEDAELDYTLQFLAHRHDKAFVFLERYPTEKAIELFLLKEETDRKLYGHTYFKKFLEGNFSAAVGGTNSIAETYAKVNRARDEQMAENLASIVPKRIAELYPHIAIAGKERLNFLVYSGLLQRIEHKLASMPDSSVEILNPLTDPKAISNFDNWVISAAQKKVEGMAFESYKDDIARDILSIAMFKLSYIHYKDSADKNSNDLRNAGIYAITAVNSLRFRDLLKLSQQLNGQDELKKLRIIFDFFVKRNVPVPFQSHEDLVLHYQNKENN